MSLADPNDDYSELVPASAGKMGKIFVKARFYVLFLIIGILIGAYLQFAYITPLFTQSQLNTCSDCTKTKELLSKENNCLYSLLQDPQGASVQCSQNAVIEQKDLSNTPAPKNSPTLDSNVNPTDANSNKDFNEEAP
ncbi:MAG: hypothetical protein WCI04_02915 [archaeon]